MKRLFQDESAECSFSPDSAYKYFVVTILSIDPSELYSIKNRLKRQIAALIKAGWYKNVEPKASNLYHKNRKFGKKFIPAILTSLTAIPSLEISYIVINKENIANQSFRNAPYGTAYNYFTGVLLPELVFQDGFNDFHLIYDMKNKETHENKHFREYLETKILGDALTNNVVINLLIEGRDSDKCYGLLATDYFSWAIFRKFERRDDSYFNLFLHKLKRRREWYI